MASSTPRPLTQAGELFNNASALYDRFSASTTRTVASFMLSLPPVPDADAVVLDNACGTGAIALELLKLFPASGPRPKVEAVDVAPAMVDLLKKKAGDAQLPDSVLKTGVMDGQDLSFPDNSFTHSYMNFGIFFLPDGARGAGEIYRTLRPGGTAFVSSWENLGYVSHVHAAHKAVRPGDKTVWPFPFPEEWCTEEKLRQTLIAGGFAAEKIKILRKETALTGATEDELAEICTFPFAKMVEGWSEEEKAQFRDAFKASLTEEQKRTLSVEMHAFVAVADK